MRHRRLVAGDAQLEMDVDVEMAHEVWHCYEGPIVGPARYWGQDRDRLGR